MPSVGVNESSDNMSMNLFRFSVWILPRNPKVQRKVSPKSEDSMAKSCLIPTLFL